MLVGIADISFACEVRGQPCGTRHSGTIYRQRSRSKVLGLHVVRYHCITSIGGKHGSTRIVRFVGAFTSAMPWVAIAGNASGHIAVSAVSILIWLA